MAFPIELTNAIDTVTEILAAHINALEAKVGIDNSADTTSLDYKVKNPTYDEIHLTPKSSSSGPEGTIFYCSDDKKVYVGTS